MTLIKSISGIRGTIGGTVGESLTPVDVVRFASAYGQWLLDQQTEQHEALKVVIGRDARISGDLVNQLVTSSLRCLGIDVVDLGLSTTPTVEMAVVMELAHGGIILTASHNPGNWNALKLLNEKGEFISAEAGEKILEIAENEAFEYVSNQHLGSYSQDDSYIGKHIQKILELPYVDIEAIAKKKFKVVIDCVNSTGGIAVPMLLNALGVDHVEKLYCEPNGKFPHNPEPLPENITEISHKLETGSYHVGFVVDPDVDRLAIVCEDGTPFGEEYTLVAVADYILKSKVGNTVSNLSSTRALRDVTEKAGGVYTPSAVGEVNVVTAMKETNAVIGGEGNGGIIYPDLHYGRDALVGIALFLSHLAKFKGTAKMLRMKYPNYSMSKNKIELTPEINVDTVLEEVREKYHLQPINMVDGLKIEFDNQWVHLRKSNTEPIIRIYTEAESQSAADHLAQKIISDIKEIIAFKPEE